MNSRGKMTNEMVPTADELFDWPCEGRCGRDLHHVEENHHDEGDGSGTWHCGACWSETLEGMKKDRAGAEARLADALGRLTTLEGQWRESLERCAASASQVATLREALMKDSRKPCMECSHPKRDTVACPARDRNSEPLCDCAADHRLPALTDTAAAAKAHDERVAKAAQKEMFETLVLHLEGQNAIPSTEMLKVLTAHDERVTAPIQARCAQLTEALRRLAGAFTESGDPHGMAEAGVEDLLASTTEAAERHDLHITSEAQEAMMETWRVALAEGGERGTPVGVLLEGHDAAVRAECHAEALAYLNEATFSSMEAPPHSLRKVIEGHFAAVHEAGRKAGLLEAAEHFDKGHAKPTREFIVGALLARAARGPR